MRELPIQSEAISTATPCWQPENSVCLCILSPLVFHLVSLVNAIWAWSPTSRSWWELMSASFGLALLLPDALIRERGSSSPMFPNPNTKTAHKLRQMASSFWRKMWVPVIIHGWPMGIILLGCLKKALGKLKRLREFDQAVRPREDSRTTWRSQDLLVAGDCWLSSCTLRIGPDILLAHYTFPLHLPLSAGPYASCTACDWFGLSLPVVLQYRTKVGESGG